MASFPSLPLFVREFLTDTTQLSLMESGAYLHILMHSWNRAGCSVPDDDKKLALWCKISIDEWAEIRPEIEPYFTIKNGQWTQKRLLKEFKYVKTLTNKRKEAGKRGGDAKALNKKENTHSKATPKPYQNPSDALAPTPTPTPTVKVIDKSITKNKRGTRIPQDWVLPDEWKEWAIEQGADATLEGDKFYNYWIAKSGQGATKLDWGATWKNWILNNYGGKAAHSGNGMASLLAKEMTK